MPNRQPRAGLGLAILAMAGLLALAGCGRQSSASDETTVIGAATSALGDDLTDGGASASPEPASVTLTDVDDTAAVRTTAAEPGLDTGTPVAPEPLKLDDAPTPTTDTAPVQSNLPPPSAEDVAAAMSQASRVWISTAMQVADSGGGDEFKRYLTISMHIEGESGADGIWSFEGEYSPGPPQGDYSFGTLWMLLSAQKSDDGVTVCAPAFPDGPCEWLPGEEAYPMMCRERSRFTGDLASLCEQVLASPIEMAFEAYESGDTAAVAIAEVDGSVVLGYDLSARLNDAAAGTGLDPTGGQIWVTFLPG